MWVPVFDQNRDHVIEVIDTYIAKMNLFKSYISEGENEKVGELIHAANQIQTTLTSNSWNKQ
jgi:prephenate dehydrogenase